MSSQLEPPFEFGVLREQARDGSRDALGHLLEYYRPVLIPWLESHRADPFQTKVSDSDCVQTAFLAAIRDFPHFNGHSHEQLRSWLQTILQHTYLNLVRGCRAARRQNEGAEVRLEQLSPDDVALTSREPDPLTAAIRREQAKQVREVLMSLPDSEREILSWHYRDGLSFADIADRLGCTAREVRNQVFRTLRRISRVLSMAG